MESIGDKLVYPSIEPTEGFGLFSSGMTYRMWLIGQIASGIVSTVDMSLRDTPDLPVYRAIANSSVFQADAIIEVLDQEKGLA